MLPAHTFIFNFVNSAHGDQIGTQNRQNPEGHCEEDRKEVWLKKWEGLTWKCGKDWPEKMGKWWLEKWERVTQKMGRPGSKIEKDWLGKVGRTDPKNGKVWLGKWEGLTWGRRDPKKNRKLWLGKAGRTDWKSEKDWLEKWEGLTLNMEGLSQNREGPIQNHSRSDLQKEGLFDTSQPLQNKIPFFKKLYSW